jgi:hypothetical protein
MNEWGNNPATWEAIGATVSAIGIIAVGLSTWAALGSLSETKAQRRAIENEMAARMRPWVGLFNCDFNLNFDGLEPDELNLLLRNFGTLPAQKASLTITLAPLKENDGEPSNPIKKEESGSKVLLPQEEGNYRITLSDYPQFAPWKNDKRDLKVTGEFSYCLGNANFNSRFLCTLKFGMPGPENKPFKLNWRNLEVS